MINSRLFPILAAAWLAILPLSLLANSNEKKTSEFTALDWLKKDKEFNRWCTQTPLISKTKVFPDTLEKVKKIRVDYCDKEIISLEELQERIVDLLNDLNRLFPVSNTHLQIQSLQIAKINTTGELGLFTVEVINDKLLVVSLSNEKDYKVEKDVLKKCDESAKKFTTESNCKAALKDFEFIYNFAQATLSQPIAFELSKRLSTLEAKWNDFYNESKSQAIWETAINGAIFQEDNNEHIFAEPPNWQLVVMHPTIVIENVKDAVDGDQLKEAVMIEVIGADWWQQDRWYLPSGGAFIATYSDRSAVDDWGYGIALNFDSKFTVGVSDHDGDTGVFITIDLLKLIQDKSSIIESYRESIKF